MVAAIFSAGAGIGQRYGRAGGEDSPAPGPAAVALALPPRRVLCRAGSGRLGAAHRQQPSGSFALPKVVSLFRPAYRAAFNMLFSNDFPLDQLSIPWGTSLLAVATRTPERQWHRDNGGWPNLRGACQAVAGLAARECNLFAPAPHKPVLRVAYTLVPAPQLRAETAAAYWLPPLTRLLGPPTTTEPVAAPRPEPGALLLRATWQLPAHRVTLLLYRAALATEPAPTATLHLEWTDEPAATQPFAAGYQAQLALLEAAAPTHPDLTCFTLHDEQPGGPATADTVAAQAQRALYYTGRHRTPAWLRARLTTRQVSLWPLAAHSAYALSTHWFTVLLPSSPPANYSIDLVTTHPAKGGGFMSLHVGELVLYDVYRSPVLEQLAAELQALALARVARYYNYDC